MALANASSATAGLLVFGVACIGSALYYRLPFPLPPLKGMAAIAVAACSEAARRYVKDAAARVSPLGAARCAIAEFAAGG